MANDQLSRTMRRWVYRIRPAGRPALARKTTLRLEECESRLAPAVLPAVTLVTDTTVALTSDPDQSSGIGVQAAYNPAEPNKIVMVTTDLQRVVGQFTTDGGATWATFFNTARGSGDQSGGRVVDPTINQSVTPIQQRVYTNASTPSVAFGRDGMVYVVHLQHNADKSSGAVVFHKFNFAGATPAALDLDQTNLAGPNNRGAVLYRWVGQDPVSNPVVAINNNISTYTDPVTGRTFTDTMSNKAVYVAWNTEANAISSQLGLRSFDEFGNVVDAVFNPNTIVSVVATTPNPAQPQVMQFTDPQAVSDDGYLPTTAEQRGAVQPKIVFNQGNGTTQPGGVLKFVWSRPLTGTSPGQIVTDSSQPDNGVAGTPASTVFEQQRSGAASTTQSSGTGEILDAGFLDQLAQATTATDPFIFLKSIGGYPTTFPFNIRIDTEVLRVTGSAPTSNAFFVTRGVNGSTAATHAANATVFVDLGVTLSLDITATQTTFRVSPGGAAAFANFAQFPFIGIGSEIMRITGVTPDPVFGDTITVIRGVSSTAATATAGAQVLRKIRGSESNQSVYQQQVTIPAGFGQITDLNLDLSLVHPNVQTIRVDLYAPGTAVPTQPVSGTAGALTAPGTLTLFLNRILPPGSNPGTRQGTAPIIPAGIDQAATNLGVRNYEGFFLGGSGFGNSQTDLFNGGGLTFSDQAARSINDPNNVFVTTQDEADAGTARYRNSPALVGEFRPDTNTAFNTQSFAGIINYLNSNPSLLNGGTWTLVITDYTPGPQPSATEPNPRPNLIGWGLKFSGRVDTGTNIPVTNTTSTSDVIGQFSGNPGVPSNTITLTDTAGFPTAAPFFIQVGNGTIFGSPAFGGTEIVQVTAVNGNVFTIAPLGAGQGSFQFDHAAGSAVQIVTTLAADVPAATSGTTGVITITNATGFPTVGGFRITVGAEQMLVTAVSVDTNPLSPTFGLTQFTVTRGLAQTSASAHVAGEFVTGIPGGSPFGIDTPIAGTARVQVATNVFSYPVMPAGATNVNPFNQDVIPTVGVGPGVSVAYDTTLYSTPTGPFTTGQQTAHPGRLYLVYTGFVAGYDPRTNPEPDDTDIYLISSDDDGRTWSAPVRVNDDLITDGYSQGNRPQYMPSVAVDPLTGTVVVMWYDARNDASASRVATYIATSIDGGRTFGPQTYVNRPKDAYDATDISKNVILEPTPTQVLLANANDGLGTRQAVIAYGGRINPFWTGNNNAARTSVFTATVNTAAGPRIVSSDMGTVTAAATVQTVTGPFTYNTTRATAGTVDAGGLAVAPGTRLLDGFVVRFDRTIDPTTFTPADIVVQFQRPNGERFRSTTTPFLGIASVTVLNTPNDPLNSVFFVRFTNPQGGVGVYSYTAGPNIQDAVRDPLATGAAARGSFLDQNADGQSDGSLVTDTYAVPMPTNPVFSNPFQPEFSNTTLPLIIPGPFVEGTAVAGGTASAPGASQVLSFLNTGASAIDVTFDRDMNPASLTTPGNVLVSLYGQNGPVPGPFTITQLGTSPRTYRVTFASQIRDAGNYTLVLAPVTTSGVIRGPLSSIGDALDANQNAGLDRLRGLSPTGGVFTTSNYQTEATLAQPIGTGTTSVFLDVPDNFLIQQDLTNFPNTRIQVGIDITFPNVADLQISLFSPSGTEVKLYRSFQSNGVGTANFTNTFFDDGQFLADGTPIRPVTTAAGPFTGVFNPQLPLSVLLGESTLGTTGTGRWELRINNVPSGQAFAGTVNRFSLSLPRQDLSQVTGLGEAVADQTAVGFTVLYTDPTNDLSQNQWTAVTTRANNGANAGQATATAVDPSDPSGNTVYVGGANGGVWKTSNFLTLDPRGPTWVPLTGDGPVASLHISSIALVPRNGDVNQTIVFALTGGIDVTGPTPGVGVLRSPDGGKTWQVLDSSSNVDSSGAILPITTRGPGANQRDGLFYNAVGYKIVADPTPITTGNYVVYMAVSGSNAQAGLWRSTNSGLTWTRINTPSNASRQATDVVLAEGTTDRITGLRTRLYVAFQGDGVYYTDNASTTLSLISTTLPPANTLIQDANTVGSLPVTVDPPTGTPNGAKGRIVLATPARSNQSLQNQFLTDWLYAYVLTASGSFDGLYMTKDNGRNWVQVKIPYFNRPTISEVMPTNDETRPDIDLQNNGDGTVVVGGFDPSTPIVNGYAMGLAVDPLNPNIVYMAGTGGIGRFSAGGSIRVDVTTVNDNQAFVFYDNSRANEAGVVERLSEGSADGRPIPGDPNPHGYLYQPGLIGIYTNNVIDPTRSSTATADFLNLIRDPQNPFVSDATLLAGDARAFRNNGENARVQAYTDILFPAANATAGFGADYPADFIKQILTFIDPLTGKTRLIYSTENGVFSGVDNGDGTLVTNIGFNQVVTNNRNGNLQLEEFTAGAVHPTQAAADIAGGLFYGIGRDNGALVSSPSVLQTGNTATTGQRGSGVDVWTDSTGSGSSYQYRIPGAGNSTQFNTYVASNFFRVFNPGSNQTVGLGAGGLGQTQGLLQGDQPEQNTGQWRRDVVSTYSRGLGYFAVNPVDQNGIVIGSDAGRIFRTTNKGALWQPIGEPGQLDGTVLRSFAFGAPDVNNPQTGLSDVIYAGSSIGNVFVTRTGSGPWTRVDLSPSDNTPVMKIVANPTRGGTRDAFVVTQRGVYYLRDDSTGTTGLNYTVTDVTGDLFQQRKAIFGAANPDGPGASSDQILFALRSLTSLAVDWRFATPVSPTTPGDTYPVVYVAGDGGVFRSTNVRAAGATPAWDFFPATADGAKVDGGFLPNTLVTDLDLSIGATDPTTGLTNQTGGLNILLATTYGRGQYMIRIDPITVPPFSYQPGPRVVSVIPTTTNGGTTTTSLRVTFDQDVAAATFNGSDVLSPLVTESGVVINPSDVRITGPGPGGTTVTYRVTNTVPLFTTSQSATRVFDLFIADPNGNPVTAAGVYNVTIGVPNRRPGETADAITISDPGGNPMNQNGAAPNGEIVAANPNGPNDVFNTDIVLNNPAVTSFLGVSGLPTFVGAGDESFVTIEAKRPNGTRDTTYNGTVEVRATGTAPNGFGSQVYQSPAITGGSTLTVQLVAGVATVRVRFFETRGQNLTVRSINTASPDINPTSAATTVTAGPARSFEWSNVPGTAAAGAVTNVTLTARDEFRNVAETYTGSVTLSSQTDSQFATLNSGSLTYQFSSAQDKGSRTFAVRFGTIGNQTVTATDTSGAGFAATTPPIVVSPGALNTVVVGGYPTSVIPGTTQTVTVELRDQFNNRLTNFTGTIQLGSSDTAATFATTTGTPIPAGTPVSLAGGIGTFNVTLNTAGPQSINVTATDISTTPATVVSGSQTGITVSAPVLSATISATTVNAGTALTVTTQIVDSNGSVIPGYPGSVTVTSNGAATVSPASPQSTANGPVTTSVTPTVAGNQTITVTVTGPGGPLTQTFDVIVNNPPPPPPSNNTAPTVSVVQDQSAPADGRIGPIAFSVTDAETPASGLRVVITSSNPAVIDPAGLNRDLQSQTGSPTKSLLITPSGAVGFADVTITVTDAGNAGSPPLSSTRTFRVTVTDPLTPPPTPVPPPPPQPPVPPPTVAGTPAFAVSTGKGTQTTVALYTGAGQVISRDVALGGGSNGARVALAAVPGGFRSVAVAAPGSAPNVVVKDAATGAVLQSYQAFEASFTGGVFVSAGDLNGDGFEEVVLSPDEGGGPRIQIRDGRTGAVLTNFFGIDDANFRGGVRTAVGDVNGDGVNDLIVAAGFGGGPRVAVFDGRTVFSAAPSKLMNDFFAFEEALRNGAYVAAGDITGDGKAEIFAGAGPGGAPRVVAFDGAGLLAGQFNRAADFLAGNVNSRAGIPIATANLNGDDVADLVAGTGAGAGARVTGYNGAALRGNGSPSPLFAFDETIGFDGGVFVG